MTALAQIGYLVAIDRVLDMMRTMTNVTGQVLVPTLVAMSQVSSCERRELIDADARRKKLASLEDGAKQSWTARTWNAAPWPTELLRQRPELVR